jgi:hypothetical protein
LIGIVPAFFVVAYRAPGVSASGWHPVAAGRPSAGSRVVKYFVCQHQEPCHDAAPLRSLAYVPINRRPGANRFDRRKIQIIAAAVHREAAALDAKATDHIEVIRAQHAHLPPGFWPAKALNDPRGLCGRLPAPIGAPNGRCTPSRAPGRITQRGPNSNIPSVSRSAAVASPRPGQERRLSRRDQVAARRRPRFEAARRAL